MLGDFCVGVKAVNNAEMFCDHRSGERKIGCASAAVDNDVDFILKFRYFIKSVNSRTIGSDLY